MLCASWLPTTGALLLAVESRAGFPLSRPEPLALTQPDWCGASSVLAAPRSRSAALPLPLESRRFVFGCWRLFPVESVPRFGREESRLLGLSVFVSQGEGIFGQVRTRCAGRPQPSGCGRGLVHGVGAGLRSHGGGPLLLAEALRGNGRAQRGRDL